MRYNKDVETPDGCHIKRLNFYFKPSVAADGLLLFPIGSYFKDNRQDQPDDARNTTQIAK